jgi:hypothetical protein
VHAWDQRRGEIQTQHEDEGSENDSSHAVIMRAWPSLC